MRTTRTGSLLLTLGVLVGGAASVGLLSGFEPARLPAALLNIAAYKLTFLAAFGLIAAGAIVQRYGRQQVESEIGRTPDSPSRSAAGEILSGQPEQPAVGRVRDQVHARMRDKAE